MSRRGNAQSTRTPQKWDTDGILLQNPQPGQSIRWDTCFPDNPQGLVEIDIGVGKGAFLLQRASCRPDVNFLGLEYAMSYAAYTADRVRRQGLENVRILGLDAGPFLARSIPASSVWRVHVYFPDPWPKRRHHRRRLIQPTFVQDILRVLKPGGQLLVVTDHQGYFQQIRAVLTDVPHMAHCAFPDLLREEGDGIVGTNFEKKYRREGRPFYRLARLRYV